MLLQEERAGVQVRVDETRLREALDRNPARCLTRLPHTKKICAGRGKPRSWLGYSRRSTTGGNQGVRPARTVTSTGARAGFERTPNECHPLGPHDFGTVKFFDESREPTARREPGRGNQESVECIPSSREHLYRCRSSGTYSAWQIWNVFRFLDLSCCAPPRTRAQGPLPDQPERAPLANSSSIHEKAEVNHNGGLQLGSKSSQEANRRCLLQGGRKRRALKRTSRYNPLRSLRFSWVFELASFVLRCNRLASPFL